MLASILVFSACSAGAGLQATPPAPITPTGDSSASAPAPPVSQSVTEGSVPTGAGGRFLLI